MNSSHRLGKGGIHILITDLPPNALLSGEGGGYPEVLVQTVILLCELQGVSPSVTRFKFLSCVPANWFLCDARACVESSWFLLNACVYVCYISMTMCSHQYNYDCISTCPVNHMIQGFMSR